VKQPGQVGAWAAGDYGWLGPRAIVEGWFARHFTDACSMKKMEVIDAHFGMELAGESILLPASLRVFRDGQWRLVFGDLLARGGEVVAVSSDLFLS
jgi:hypothetical protein